MKKAYIIQEIKRTAGANGGKPLGRMKFESETGIKESDWLGVYWARWGDAVREAGFTPNQLQGAYDKTELLENYAKLTLELGRLPVYADLRLKARNYPEFPSHNTFNRIGTKAQVITQLIEHCRSHIGYERVVRLCEAYAPRTREGA